METLLHALRRVVAVCGLIVAAPILLLALLFYLGAGALGGFIVSRLVSTILLTVLGSLPIPVQWAIAVPFMAGGAFCAAVLWDQRFGVRRMFGLGLGDTHGSARLASKREIAALTKSADLGLLIGRDPKTGKLLGYDGPAHLLTLAPTRAGKGVGTVIPNLLMGYRSMLVIDPKGENVRVAGVMRANYGPSHVLDPFGVSGTASATYNPLERLSPDSLDLGEDASTLAEALVMDPPGQTSDAHWNEEAKALIAGLILFCVVHEDVKRKHLGTVREYLTLPPERFQEFLSLMQESRGANGLIARAANRFLGKADREAAGVLSGAQRHTHFLDSPRIARCLATSDFRFADLRREITTVFLVLPPNRLDAYGRWLRLLVSEALQDIARDAEMGASSYAGGQTRAAETRTRSDSHGDAPGAPFSPERTQGAETVSPSLPGPLTASQRPSRPTLFLLDEFAGLGRLEVVERAMGLMAGYGVQLWPILQDLSQLRDLYGARANTFVANAGVLQVFGVNDVETAKWLSQALGKETIGYETATRRFNEMPTSSEHVMGRELLTPDEIMRMASHLQLLRLQGMSPVLARKLRYYADAEFDGLYASDAA